MQDTPSVRKYARDVDRGPGWKPYARYEINNYGHATWRQEAGARYERRNFPVHRLLAVAEYGFQAVAGKHVHHENEIPWDNRPENITLMSPEEHASHHSTGDYRVDTRELLLDIRAGREFLGYQPRASDYKEFSPHSLGTLINRFGSYTGALEAAGIDPDTGKMEAYEHWVQECEFLDGEGR